MAGFDSKGFGASMYGQVGLRTDIINAEPHRLVTMLFDGALLSVGRAKGHMAARRIAEKCQAIGHAVEIVDSGLRVSVDASHDPAFAGRLISLYQYIVMRLLQANLRNDVAALDEAARLLEDLRRAWLQIDPARRAGSSAPQRAAAVAEPDQARPARHPMAAY